ncbi:MAG TPA: hypothetical protein VMT89_00540 [Candidatus Acidoferrales bacterium]|nr:hypothetical protein [Candidatus Acidoferrales bacterium]
MQNPTREVGWGWSRTADRRKAERETVRTLGGELRAYRAPIQQGKRFVVTLVRIAPNKLDRGDNLSIALKSVRDELADLMGLPNDRDPRVEWAYDQRKEKPRTYGVEVRIEPRRLSLSERLDVLQARESLLSVTFARTKDAWTAGMHHVEPPPIRDSFCEVGSAPTIQKLIEQLVPDES